MADMTREKLRAILLEQTESDLQRIWAAALGNNKTLLVDEILQYGDHDITQALRKYMNWDFHVKD